MNYLKFAYFTLRNLSRMGLWQAGAELTGSDTLRARANGHARVHAMAQDALHAEVRARLDTRAARTTTNA